jgi:aminopeptidase N
MERESGKPLARFFERWIHEAGLPQVAFSWREEVDGDGGRQAILRFEQTGNVFDLPVQASVLYEDGRSTDVVALLSEKVTELPLPLVGRVRSIEANRNGLALVEIK